MDLLHIMGASLASLPVLRRGCGNICDHHVGLIQEHLCRYLYKNTDNRTEKWLDYFISFESLSKWLYRRL